MTLTPLMVELSKRNVVIIGGGRIAERRVHILLESGAFITIVSPEIGPGIYSLWEKGFVDWRQKDFEAKDLDQAFLIIVATNDPEVNQSVVQASLPHSLISVASDAIQGNVQFPAHFKQGKLSVSISTNGASPMLSAKIKKELHTIFDKNYGDYVDFLYECRQLIKQTSLDKKNEKLLLNQLLSEDFLNSNKQKQTMEWLKNISGLEA